MYKLTQPLFAIDGVAEGYFPKSWGDTLRDASPSDDQPDTESDGDDYEDAEQEEQDEPNNAESDDEDDAEEADEQPDTEEAQVEEDPDIDLGDGTKPVKMSELKAGFMRQADYTKKTQALATERKEIEQQRESLKDAQGFKDHMEANPWLWEQIQAAIKTFNETEILPLDELLQESSGRYLNHLLADNNRLNKALETASNERDGLSLSNTMSKLERDLRADYGDLVTDEYMDKLSERAKAEKLAPETLKEIAEGYLAKQALRSNKQNVKKESKKAEAKAIQKLAETKRSAPTTSKPMSAKPAKETKRHAGWRDFFESLE